MSAEIFLRAASPARLTAQGLPKTPDHKSALRVIRLSLETAAAIDVACARTGAARGPLLRALIEDGLARLEVA